MLILLSAVLAPQISSGQTLSIDECVQMALRENKSVKAAEWKADQYMHTSKSLKANYFPRVSLQVADLWSSLGGKYEVDVANPVSDLATRRVTELFPSFALSDVGSWYLSTLPDRLAAVNPEVSYKVGNIFSAMAQIEQPIYMGGKIKAGYTMGQLGEKMAKIGVAISEDEVVLKTYEAYSLVNKAKEMQVVALQYDSLLVQIYNTVSSAAKNGMARQADLMKVQAAKSKSELQIHQAENGLKLATMNLCQIIGLPLLSRIDVNPVELSIDTREAVRSFDVSSRHEYEALDMQARIAEQKINLERADFLPQVGLVLAGGYLHGGQVINQTFFNNQMQATVALSVKIPIFHAGEGIHKVAAARAEYEQARLEQANLNEMMALEIQQAVNELDEAELEERLNRNLMDEAAEGLRMSRKAYDHGMETITDLLTAQTEWQNAYAQYVESRHNYVIKQINLKKVTGNLKTNTFYENQ